MQERKSGLVNRLIEQLLLDNAPEIKKLVGHRFPDDDVWLSIWIARKFMPKVENAEIEFVNAGTSLPGSENDPSIVHFDTGGGEYDQHGKRLLRTCSAGILAEKLGVQNDPGLNPLLEMVTAVDNAENVQETSLHFLIEGWPRTFNDGGGTDWKKVQKRVFEAFDSIYAQERGRSEKRATFHKVARPNILRNGLAVISLGASASHRAAAFEKGAAVVVWEQPKGKRGFYVGIQRSNKFRKLGLHKVVLALRLAEAKARGLEVETKDLESIGRGEPATNWFLHDSLGLILSGSRTWELSEDEFTKLSFNEIVRIIGTVLSAVPVGMVSEWKGERDLREQITQLLGSDSKTPLQYRLEGVLQRSSRQR